MGYTHYIMFKHDPNAEAARFEQWARDCYTLYESLPKYAQKPIIIRGAAGEGTRI